MGEPYPGEVKFVTCPLCGAQVKLVVNRDWHWEGSCPQCHKLIKESNGKEALGMAGYL